MDLLTRQNHIVSEFNACEDWTDKMRLLISKGTALEALSDQDKNTCAVIKNCQTTMWVNCSVNNNTVQLAGDCDSKTMRGILALCIELLHNRDVTECSQFDFGFLDQIGLDTIVSSNRSTGLDELINTINTTLKQSTAI